MFTRKLFLQLTPRNRIIKTYNFCVGERVDFILQANQTPGFYWLHVRGLGERQEREIYQLGILAYQGSSNSSLSPKPGYVFSPSNTIVSIINIKFKNFYILKSVINKIIKIFSSLI